MHARLFLLVALACGCNNPVYLAETAHLETLPAPPMTMSNNGWAPATGLYVLPVRRPTASERQALTQLQQKLALPQPVPWAAARDFDVEIEYSVRNVDMQPVTATVALNGGNEFGDYVPTAYLNPRANQNDQTPPPPLVGGELLEIAPGGVVTGVFREDQLQKSSLDLEAITRYPSMMDVLATPYEVIENHTMVTRTGFEGIPANDVTPMHVRYAFIVSAGGHVVMDYTVRVRDHAGKLADPAQSNLYVSTAANLAPPVAPPKR
jgi:hypothetical protein